MYKNRGFWEGLQQSRALCAIRDKSSNIRVAFREIHSGKGVQMIVFKILYKIYNLCKKVVVFIQEFSKLSTNGVYNLKY